LLPLLVRLSSLEQQLQQHHLRAAAADAAPVLQTIRQLVLGGLPDYLFEELKRQMWAKLDHSISISTGSPARGSTGAAACVQTATN